MELGRIQGISGGENIATVCSKDLNRKRGNDERSFCTVSAKNAEAPIRLSDLRGFLANAHWKENIAGANIRITPLCRELVIVLNQLESA
jgi:hypothetical protein